MTTSRRLLDPTAIARLAAAAVGEVPDAVIRRELRRAGIRGTSALGVPDCADTRSAEWRAAWLACEREWRAIAFPEGQPTERAGTRSQQPYGRSSKITAAVLWHAYQCGERQKEIARRYSVSANSVRKRSQRLGFRLRYRPGTSGPPQIVAGPCLECGRPRPVEALNQYRRCRGGCNLDESNAKEAA